MKKLISLAASVGFLLASSAGWAYQPPQQGDPNPPASAHWGNESKKAKTDTTIRPVKGMVTTEDGKPVQGAVVKLKNSKTLQVRSFITQQDGRYHFYGLSVDVDYELTAQYHGAKSKTRTLSVFNSNTDPVINLELKAGAEEAATKPPPAKAAKTDSKPGN